MRIGSVTYQHWRVPLHHDHVRAGRPRRKWLWKDTDKAAQCERGGISVCTIHLVDENGMRVSRVQGYAYCSMSDVFDKKEGRRRAYDRARKSLPLGLSLGLSIEEFRKAVDKSVSLKAVDDFGRVHGSYGL